MVGKLLRQDRGTPRRRGKTGGEGGGVGDCCDGMGLGCRGQDWCDGRGAHIAIPGGWTRAPLFGGGVPMSISPKDALKSVVTRTMDSFVSFPSTLTTRTVMTYPSVAVKIQRTNTYVCQKSRRKQRHASIMREAGRTEGGRAPLAWSWLALSEHPFTSHEEEGRSPAIRSLISRVSRISYARRRSAASI